VVSSHGRCCRSKTLTAQDNVGDDTFIILEPKHLSGTSKAVPTTSSQCIRISACRTGARTPVCILGSNVLRDSPPPMTDSRIVSRRTSQVLRSDRFLEHVQGHLGSFFLRNQHSPRKEDWGNALMKPGTTSPRPICGSHPSSWWYLRGTMGTS
jgi:hypothetical protein